MHCLRDTINQSLNYGYASYSAINDNRELCAFSRYPDELDAWYLGIYIDAIEWVEITNTRDESICRWWDCRDKTLCKFGILY
jgi:deoxyribodipyrimidine photolyase-related protein